MMIPLRISSKVDRYHWGYGVLNQNQTNFSTHGITPLIFNIASKKYNFKDEYVLFIPDDELSIFYLGENDINIYAVNGTYKTPNVYFDLFGIQQLLNTNLRMTRTFFDLKFELFVTPAVTYSPYEKLLLPFDIFIWTFLVVTFVATFIVIFILNHLSKSIQWLVYGKQVQTPFLNVISILLGISQTKLPTESFSRFILILFIFFCLIFRTCYQSKMYEFMTSEPRRPPPKTIHDLISRSYLMYSAKISRVSDLVRDSTETW